MGTYDDISASSPTVWHIHAVICHTVVFAS